MSRSRHQRNTPNNRRWLWFGIAAVVIALLGALIWSSSGESTPAVPDSELLKVSADDWRLGDPNAPVTLIEYGDYQCPSCAAYAPLVKSLVASYGGKLQLVYRHYPLSAHPNAIPSARAAEAAGAQGKFWEMSDMIFARQAEWSDSSTPNDVFAGYAGELGLDVTKFKSDLGDGAIDRKILAQRATGSTLEIRGTPSFFVNGEKLEELPDSEEAFRAIIDAAMAKAGTTSTTTASSSSQ